MLCSSRISISIRLMICCFCCAYMILFLMTMVGIIVSGVWIILFAVGFMDFSVFWIMGDLNSSNSSLTASLLTVKIATVTKTFIAYWWFHLLSFSASVINDFEQFFTYCYYQYLLVVMTFTK